MQERQPRITKSTVEVYKLRNCHHGEWADITIDEGDTSGRISISSGYGDWAFYWGACGCPFKEFLAGLEISYTAGKFGVGHVLDLSETVKEWKREVVKYRKQDGLTEEQAREIWTEITCIEVEAPDMEGLKFMLWNTEHLMSWYESEPRIVTDISPSFQYFWKYVWSVFVDQLKSELTATAKVA